MRISEREASFGATALAISAIIRTCSCFHSTLSLVAGAAFEHLEDERTVPTGIALPGIGCIHSGALALVAGGAGGLLQGAGAAFAFTQARIQSRHKAAASQPPMVTYSHGKTSIL